MQTTLVVSTLVDNLTLLSKIPTKHPSLQYMAHIHISIEGEICTLTAHGIGISVQILQPVKQLTTTGECSIDCAILLQFVSSLKSTTVELTVTEGVCVCSDGESVAEIKLFEQGNYPAYATTEHNEWFSGSGQLVADMIKKVSFACASSDIRPELSSIYCVHKNGYLVMAATDSFVLAETRTPNTVVNDTAILIPNKYSSEIQKFCSHMDVCTLYYDNNSMTIESKHISVTIRTIVGSYPDYEQIIPKTFNCTIETLKDDIKNAFKSVVPFTEATFPKVVVTPKPESDICECETDYNEKGRGKSQFRALISGELDSMRIHIQYVNTLLNNIQSSRIVLSCVDPQKPILVTSPDDVHFRALIMPLGR